MPTKTKIEWTDYTSNPIRYRTADGRVVWACEKVSAGCQNCYAEALSRRYTHRRAGDWNAATMATLTPFLDEKEVHHLLHMKSLAGKRVFIGDMTDVFGEWVPDEILDRLFAVFAMRTDVEFQVLTKRAQRMRAYFTADPDGLTERVGEHLWDMHTDYTTNALPLNPWPLPNVWLGVSAENQQRADERVADLLLTPAAVRFVSAEPLIDQINVKPFMPKPMFYCARCGKEKMRDWCEPCGTDNNTATNEIVGIDWLIVGGESGLGARLCRVAWIRSIVEQCRDAAVPVFVKQMGAIPRVSGPMSASGEWANPCVVTAASGGTHIVLKDRKGGDPAEWPEDLRVRQFPNQAEAR